MPRIYDTPQPPLPNERKGCREKIEDSTGEVLLNLAIIAIVAQYLWFLAQNRGKGDEEKKQENEDDQSEDKYRLLDDEGINWSNTQE